MCRHATKARSTVFAARLERPFNLSSEAAIAPVRNSHSARSSSSSKVSSWRRFQESSGSSVGAFPCAQVKLRQVLALLSRGDQGDAAVELIDDVEDCRFLLLRRDMRSERPAYSKMRF